MCLLVSEVFYSFLIEKFGKSCKDALKRMVIFEVSPLFPLSIDDKCLNLPKTKSLFFQLCFIITTQYMMHKSILLDTDIIRTSNNFMYK